MFQPVWRDAEFERHMDKLQKVLQPPSTHFEGRQRLEEAIDSILHSDTGLVQRLMVCGSFAQGTALAGSDLDLSILFSSDTEDMVQIARDEQVRILRKIACGIGGCHSEHGFSVEEQVFTATVPIVRLAYGKGEKRLPVDLCIGNSSSGKRDAVVRDLLERNPRVKAPLSVIKQWAKARHITKAFEGFPNSVSWSLLYITHCQMSGTLPPYGQREVFVPPTEQVHPSDLDILISFFGFVTHYGSDGTLAEVKCSVLQGCFLQRGEEEEGEVLLVEDPADVTNNVSRATQATQWQATISQAHRAFDILNAIRARNSRAHDASGVPELLFELLRETDSAYDTSISIPLPQPLPQPLSHAPAPLAYCPPPPPPPPSMPMQYPYPSGYFPSMIPNIPGVTSAHCYQSSTRRDESIVSNPPLTAEQIKKEKESAEAKPRLQPEQPVQPCLSEQREALFGVFNNAASDYFYDEKDKEKEKRAKVAQEAADKQAALARISASAPPPPSPPAPAPPVSVASLPPQTPQPPQQPPQPQQPQPVHSQKKYEEKPLKTPGSSLFDRIQRDPPAPLQHPVPPASLAKAVPTQHVAGVCVEYSAITKKKRKAQLPKGARGVITKVRGGSYAAPGKPAVSGVLAEVDFGAELGVVAVGVKELQLLSLQDFLPLGAAVAAKGLSDRPHLNGVVGEVIGYSVSSKVAEVTVKYSTPFGAPYGKQQLTALHVSHAPSGRTSPETDSAPSSAGSSVGYSSPSPSPSPHAARPRRCSIDSGNLSLNSLPETYQGQVQGVQGVVQVGQGQAPMMVPGGYSSVAAVATITPVGQQVVQGGVQGAQQVVPNAGTPVAAVATPPVYAMAAPKPEWTCPSASSVQCAGTGVVYSSSAAPQEFTTWLGNALYSRVLPYTGGQLAPRVCGMLLEVCY